MLILLKDMVISMKRKKNLGIRVLSLTVASVLSFQTVVADTGVIFSLANENTYIENDDALGEDAKNDTIPTTSDNIILDDDTLDFGMDEDEPENLGATTESGIYLYPSKVTSYKYTLAWNAYGDEDITKYEIYRDGVILSSVDKNEENQYEYADKKVSGKAYSYTIVGVDGNGTAIATSNERNITYDGELDISWGNNSDYILDEDMTVGSLSFASSSYALDLNGHTLTVAGDILLTNSPKIKFNGGTLECVNIKRNPEYSGNAYLAMYMNNEKDHFIVNENYYLSEIDNSLDLSAGLTEIKGNIMSDGKSVYDSNRYATGTHKLLLNGNNPQTIDFVNDYAKTCFNILELDNKSEEGVIFYTPLVANEIIYNNTNYSFGGYENAKRGWTLTKDETLNGLVLDGGTLDLNGKQLHIKGDLLQLNGTINVNGGNLIIDGEYRNGYVYPENYTNPNVYSNNSSNYRNMGKLIMTNENDRVYVGKNMVFYTAASEKGLLTNGQMSVKGNVVINDYVSSYSLKGHEELFYTQDNFKLILCGDDSQELSSNSETPISNLLIKDREEGKKVTLYAKITGDFIDETESAEGTVYIDSIKDIQKYGGNLKLSVLKDVTLDKDYVINDTVSFSNKIDLNGHKLVCKKDCSIYGSLIMKNSNDYLTVEGAYTFRDNLASESVLTDGTIEALGQVLIYNSYADISNNHTLYLNGNNGQQVSLGSYNDKLPVGILKLSENLTSINADTAFIEGVHYASLIDPNGVISGQAPIDNKTLKGSEQSIVLDDDVTWNSNVTIDHANLNLNGKSLVINGNLTLNSGHITFGTGGSLRVKGNLTIKDNEYYNTTYLYMYDTNNRLTVDKNVMVYCYANHFYYMQYGQFDIGGDFTAYNWSGYATRDLYPQDNFIFNFNGNSRQSIYYSSDVRFRTTNLVLNNKSESGISLGGIYVSKSFSDNGSKTFGDVYFNGNVKVANNTVNANTVIASSAYHNDEDIVFNGDLTINSPITVNNNIFVKKNLVVSSKVNVAGAALTCDGITTLYNAIELTKDNGNNPTLNLNDLTFNYSVKNNWKEGNVNVKGNISIESGKTLASDYAIHASDNNMLVLEGTKKQTVNMPYTSDYFNKIVIKNSSSEGVEFTNGIKAASIDNETKCPVKGEKVYQTEGFILDSDKTVDSIDFAVGKIDLNGHTLTVNGDLKQGGADIIINGGKLIVKGDYIIEDSTAYSCNANLIMQEENDYVLVYGNFVMASYAGANKQFSDGVLEVKGDVIQRGYANNFECTDNFKLLLSGDKKQTVRFEKYIPKESSKLQLQNVEITNKSSEGVVFENKVPIAGKLITNKNKVNGDITIKNSAVLEQNDNYFPGNVHILNSFTINNPLSIGGNLTIGNDGETSENVSVTANLASDISVAGNLALYGTFNVNANQITVNGSLKLGGKYAFLNNDDSYVWVKGDILAANSFGGYSLGTIETEGNILFDNPDEKNNQTTIWNSIVLSGKSLQKLMITSSVSFGEVTLINPNREGIVINQSKIPSDNIKANGVKVKYLSNDVIGYKLSDNEIWEGGTVLAGGELDLNGYTLTVKGDLIAEGGTIKMNKGRLEVEGDLRLQKVTFDEEHEIESTSKGSVKLSFEDAKDYLFIGKNMYIETDQVGISHGTVELKGNLYDMNLTGSIPYFSCDKMILSGNTKQTLSSKSSYSGDFCFKNLYIENTSSQGISSTRRLYVQSEFRDQDNKINSNTTVVICDISKMKTIPAKAQLCLYANTLDRDITGVNKLIISNSLNMYGHTIHAKDCDINGSLTVNQGRLEIENNLTSDSSGQLYMDNANDYVYVGGNVSLYSLSRVNDGCIEVHGDFKQTCTYNGYCNVGENNTIILAGKADGSIQKVELASENAKLGKIVLWRDIENYSFNPSLDKICITYSREEVDETAPSKVTGLNAEADGVNTDLNWNEATDDNGVMGYLIYRNGVKVGLTADTSFADTGLKPEQEYKYYVCAFDARNNISLPSDTVTVKTGKDTVAPTAPEYLSVSSSPTGSRIGLSWRESTDNVAVKGYNVYRDGELIGYSEDTWSFADTDVEPDTLYSYYVTAIDESGNESEASEAVNASAPLPDIYSVSPNNNDQKGGKSVYLNIVYKHITYDYYKASFYYKKNGDKSADWNEIGSSYGKSTYSGSSYYEAGYSWQTDGIESGLYDIRFVLEDSDHNIDEKVVTVSIDTTPAAKPGSFTADALSGVVKLAWSTSSSDDASMYKVYRSNTLRGNKTLLTTTNSTVYDDKNVENNVVYYYFVSAVDKFGLEGEMTDAVKVTVSADLKSPAVLFINSKYEEVGGEQPLEVTVEATDDRRVDTISTYYRKVGSDHWESLIADRKADDNKISFQISVKNFKDGKYEIKASAKDSSGNVSKNDDSVIEYFTVDNTGSSKVRLGASIAKPSYAILRWNEVNDKDFNYYVVEQKDENNEFKKIATVASGTSYTVFGLETETKYYFRIVGYDLFGNRGIPSDVIEIETLSDKEAPHVASVNPERGSFNNEIKFNVLVKDNVATEKLYIEYSQDTGDDKQWKTNPPVVATDNAKNYEYNYTLKTDSFNEGELYVRLYSSDASGNVSEKEYLTFTIDHTAPGKVENLSGSGYDGHIKLTWDSLKDNDLSGFEIYRKSQVAGTEYTLLDTVDAMTYSYVDETADIGTVYYYMVCAVDYASNKGEQSDEISAEAGDDTTAPEVINIYPLDNSVITGNTNIRATVTDYGYLKNVTFKYRKNASEDWKIIDTVNYALNDKKTTATVDVNWDVRKLQNTNYFVCVEATDYSDNTNEDQVVVYSVDTVGPPATTLNAQQYGYAKIKLQWTPAYGEEVAADKDEDVTYHTDEDALGVKDEDMEVIYWGDITDPNNPLVNFDSDEADEANENTDVYEAGKVVTDNVKYFDFTNGNGAVNDYTLTGEGDAKISDEESSSLGDIAKVGDAANVYRVYRRVGGENEFKLINAVYALSYIDTGLKIGKKYDYKIATVDEAGNETFSNVVSIVPSSEDDEAPVAICNAEYSVREGEEVLFDGAKSTDNVSVESYSWNMGDGTTYSGVKVRHTYDKIGEYYGSLTVTDAAGLSDKVSFRVNVLKRSAGETHFTVCSEVNGETVNVSNAEVCIEIPGEGAVNYTADENGQIKLALEPGTYNICAYANGYIPAEQQVLVTRGDNYIPINLRSGNIVTGSLTTKRLTLDDMQRLGIDTADPDNWIRFVYHFGGASVSISPNTINVIEFGRGGGGGTCEAYVTVRQVHPGCYVSETYIVYSYLKKMYAVSLDVSNQAEPGSGFDITNTYVNLNLPEGLSLVRTSNTQSLRESYGTLSAGGSRHSDWYIKADAPGTYYLSATVTGSLMKVNADVNCTISATNPLYVSSEEDNTFPDPGFITGTKEKFKITVVNKDKRIVKGAIVTISCDGKKCNTITNNMGVGTLFINSDESRSFRLTIEHPDYLTYSVTGYQPDLSTHTDRVTIYRFGEEIDEEEEEERRNNQPIKINYAKYNQKDVLNTTMGQYIDLHNNFSGNLAVSFKEKVETYEIILVPNDNSGEIVIDSLEDMSTEYFRRNLSNSMFKNSDGEYYPNGRIKIRAVAGDKEAEYTLALYTVQSGIKSITFEDSATSDWSCDLLSHHALMFVPNDRSSDSTYTFTVNRDRTSDTSGQYLYYSLIYGTDVIVDKSFVSKFSVHGSDLDYSEGKKIYLSIYNEDGDILEKRELNISVYPMIEFNLNFGSGKIGMTMPSGFPVLGKISFTPCDGSDNDNGGKGVVVNCGCNQNGYYGTAKINMGDIENNPLKDKLPPKAEMGFYVEIGFTGNPETERYSGELKVGAEISLDKEIQVYEAPPVVAGFNLSAEGELDGTVNLYYEEGSLHISDSEAVIALSAALKVFAGLGVADVASAGVFCRATVKYALEILPELQSKKFELDGEVGVYAEFLCWEYDLILLQGLVGYNFVDKEFYYDGSTIFGEEELYDTENYRLGNSDYSDKVWYGDKVTLDSDEIQLLQKNANKFTKLSMNKAGGKDYLIMLDGRNAENEMDKSVLSYAEYNNGKFSELKPIVQSDRGQYTFDTYEADDKVYIIWQENKEEVSNGVNIDEVMNKMELHAACFDGSKVTNLGTITNNEIYESAPSIMANGNDIYAVWYENSANNPFGNVGNNVMKIAKYSNNNWTEVSGISASFEGLISSYDAGIIEGVPYAIYETGNVITAVNVTNGSSSVISSLGRNAHFSHIGANNILTFTEGSAIKMYKAAGAETLYEDTNISMANYIVVGDETNKTILYLVSGEGTADIYAVDYDTDAKEFGIPQAITANEEGNNIDKLAAGYSNGNLLTVFNCSNVTIDGEQLYRNSNLEFAKVNKIVDVTIKDVTESNESKIIPGGEAEFKIDLFNEGLKSSSELEISIKDDEGSELYSAKHPALKAGELRSENVNFKLPYNNELYSLEVTVNYNGKSDTFDYIVGYSDLEVTADAFQNDEKSAVIASVRNTGCTPTDGKIVFYDLNDETKIYAEYEVGNLFYDDSEEFEYVLPEEVYDKSKTVEIGVEVIANEDENNKTKNNKTSVYFVGESGLDTYAVIFNYAQDGMDSVTKYVYAGNKVILPNEPKVEGYTFLGWYHGDEVFDANAPINEDMTLFAEYKEIDNNGKNGNDDKGGSNDNNKPDNPKPDDKPDDIPVPVAEPENFVLVNAKCDLSKLFNLSDGNTYEYKLENKADKKKASISTKGILKGKKAGKINVAIYQVSGKGKNAVKTFVQTKEVQLASLKFVNNKYVSTYENQVTNANTLFMVDLGDRKIKLNDMINDAVVDEGYFIRSLEANGYKWQWKSSKTKIVKIDPNNGEFAAIKKGSSKVTFSILDSNGKSISKLSLNVNNKFVKFSKTAYKVKVGKKVKTKLKNVTKMQVTYSSENNEIASVDEKGVVRGISEGIVEIYATTSDGKKHSCKVTVYK